MAWCKTVNEGVVCGRRGMPHSYLLAKRYRDLHEIIDLREVVSFPRRNNIGDNLLGGNAAPVKEVAKGFTPAGLSRLQICAVMCIRERFCRLHRCPVLVQILHNLDAVPKQG